MKRKYVPVRLPGEVFERVKKEAEIRGLSVSETIGNLVRKSFESRLENRSDISPSIDLEMILSRIEMTIKSSHGYSSGIDQKSIRYQVETAIKSSHGSGSGIDPKLIRYQVETLAKIESILAAMALDRPGGEGKIMNWMKDANAKAKKTLQELQVDEIEKDPGIPKKTFPKVGEKQKEETDKGDFDFNSLPQI